MYFLFTIFSYKSARIRKSIIYFDKFKMLKSNGKMKKKTFATYEIIATNFEYKK